MSTNALSDLTIANLIGGAWTAGSGEPIDVLNPATGEVVARFTASTDAEVDAAVAAARSAQPGWAALTPGQRSAMLHRLTDAFEDHLTQLIELEVIDAGKPIEAARSEEFPALLDAMRHFAGTARVLSGQPTGEYAEGVTTTVRREPLGVVAGITPWNYPLWQAVWKIMPALAAGNTVVIKPAENTPLATTRFAQIADDLLPDGVLNIVQGLGSNTGRSLSQHPDVNLVSFTGSVQTGRAIAHAVAEGPKRAILELGGNAPVVVFDDADLDRTAQTVTEAGLYNAGQECMAATRVIVSETVAEAFTHKLLELVRQVTVGDTFDDKTVLGPLISGRQRERVEGLLARLPGHATIAHGGVRPDLPGFYLEPTVITGIRQDDEIVQEEIFGPVITIQTFTTETEALHYANGVRFGLAGSVWTRDVARALRFAKDLDFGNVWVNTHLIVGPDLPIGGFNESGYGKEGGALGIEEFTRVKQVGIQITD
ncbi:aldehyde dehydrogenase family protein [Streptomyces malaysiensis]|uniref:aldehyde dehydrogenase family protein n=1 Tax=Streptomyces malaysiensis TaxID=92644 RepID=UPI002B3172B0|nr:aldehyde dehydrogenase family protein [Streptomyces malaysiensis]